MMYEDAAEVLEALGYDPAFGLREWVGGYHVEDIKAVAEALDLRQRGIMAQWCAPNEEACFLFEDMIETYAHELDLGPLDEDVVPGDVVVMPSFKSFGVDVTYVLDKIMEFFELYCIEDNPMNCGMVRKLNRPHEDEWHVSVQEVGEHYYTRSVTLARVPVHYRYACLEEMRFELSRLLQEAIRTYGVSHWYFARGLSVRRLHWEGVRFVETLWGLAEETH